MSDYHKKDLHLIQLRRSLPAKWKRSNNKSYCLDICINFDSLKLFALYKLSKFYRTMRTDARIYNYHYVEMKPILNAGSYSQFLLIFLQKIVFDILQKKRREFSVFACWRNILLWLPSLGNLGAMEQKWKANGKLLRHFYNILVYDRLIWKTFRKKLDTSKLWENLRVTKFDEKL